MKTVSLETGAGQPGAREAHRAGRLLSSSKTVCLGVGGYKPMEIVDAQIHSPLPVVAFEPAVDPTVAVHVTTEIALSAMKAVGVDAAVFVHSGPVTLNYLDSTPIPATVGGRLHPGKFGGVITPDLDAVVDIDEMLSQLRTRVGILAIRMSPSWPKDGQNLMPRVRDGAFGNWFRVAG